MSKSKLILNRNRSRYLHYVTVENLTVLSPLEDFETKRPARWGKKVSKKRIKLTKKTAQSLQRAQHVKEKSGTSFFSFFFKVKNLTIKNKRGKTLPPPPPPDFLPILCFCVIA